MERIHDSANAPVHTIPQMKQLDLLGERREGSLPAQLIVLLDLLSHGDDSNEKQPNAKQDVGHASEAEEEPSRCQE